MRQPYRRHKGKHWSEGHRLLWLAIEREQLGQAAAARKCTIRPGQFTRLAYGDLEPNREASLSFRDVFGVPIEAWGEAEREEFVLPAARELESGPSLTDTEESAPAERGSKPAA